MLCVLQRYRESAMQELMKRMGTFRAGAIPTIKKQQRLRAEQEQLNRERKKRHAEQVQLDREQLQQRLDAEIEAHLRLR